MNDYETSSPTATHLRMRETLQIANKAIAQQGLRQLFKNKPITMHKTYQTKGAEMLFPKIIRDTYATIWSQKYTRVIIKAPRGGGKSKLLGTLGFDLWYLRYQSVVNMGGSLAQAQIVYGYFQDYCEIDDSVVGEIKGGTNGIKLGETEMLEGNKFSCVTASAKSVRGKHIDALLSDETCETSDELIHAALPMVNDSEHPLIVMASTFHKIYGIYQEIWDNAEERGYLRISWDIFDVAKPFAEDIWDRPENKGITGIDKLKKYAKGRTGDECGWIPVENIIQAWRERPTDDWFEVEYLGNRPSSAGLVLKPEDVDRARIDTTVDARYNFVQGATVIIGIDWGFSSMTAVTELQRNKDSVVSLLSNTNYSQIRSEVIIDEVVEIIRQHAVRMVYADSAGKFENTALRYAIMKARLRCSVVEVVFSKEKTEMVGNLRAYFEQGKIKIPTKYQEAYWQFKRFRYQEGTDKTVKKDDHIPDSTMCALQHFKLGQRTYRIPLQSQKRETTGKPITSGLLKKHF